MVAGEIDRLAAGRPTHPIAIALAPLRQRRDADIASLHESLVAADLDLARLTYRNWDELDAYCYRASGALQTLAAATLAGERIATAAELEFARQLGSAQRQAEMIRDFQFDLRRGRLYLPLEVIEAAGFDPSGWQLAPPKEPGPGFLTHGARVSLARWHRCPACCPRGRCVPHSDRDWCWQRCTSGY